MTDPATDRPPTPGSGPTLNIPPGPRLGAGLYGLAFAVNRRRLTQRMSRRYGPAFVLRLPAWGRTVFLSEPALVKQLFTTSPELIGKMEPNLGQVLGPSSFFDLDGEKHKRQRKLLLPPMVTLGSRLMLLPGLEIDLGRFSPWGRYRAYRREFDAIVDRLIATAKADPHIDERNDILALMLRARYDDGTAINQRAVADQLLTLLAAGHETTASSLAWAVERLRRHPDILARLAAEADEGGSQLRKATITEVQRARPVADMTGRRVKGESITLGVWVVPRGYSVMVSIGLIHDDDSVFPNAAAFDPDRFVGVNPDTYSWVPFGGGTRRCIGAAFAATEMDVVLRTLLRDFDFATTDEPDERWHSRGVTWAPERGGLAVVHRRKEVGAAAA
jgi:cytochrome P450